MTRPKPQHEHKPNREPSENLSEPAYVALSADGEFIDADDSLDELVRVLAELADPNDQEDVVIWHGHRVAAVIQCDGRVTRFDAPPAAPPPSPAPKPARKSKPP